MSGNLALVVGGLLTMVLGVILLGIMNSSAATTGSGATIGSFTGVRDVNDLYPLIFAFGGIVIGMGAMGLGIIRGVRG